MTECAVWYLRYGASRYALCDDEEEAIHFAYYLQEAGEGVVNGVQFADGRLINRGTWQALADYTEQRDQEEQAVSGASAPSAPSRQVRDPFDGQSVSLDAGAPAWLGGTQ